MNYYSVYRRAHVYRVGRPRWWGMQWTQRSCDTMNTCVHNFCHFLGARLECERVNRDLDTELAYSKDRWRLQ